MKNFIEYLRKNRKENKIRIFFDIETLQYNEEAGYNKPTLFKNCMYSFAIGYYDYDMLHVDVFHNFYEFVETVKEAYKKWKTTPKIELIAHNTNKYDNHFLRQDLKYYYDLPHKNIYLRNASDEANILTLKKSKLLQEYKRGVILEKRIKSANNLELVMFIDNIEFFTTDNYVKTNTSIQVLGQKLLNINKITENDLKTDFNYTKFNKSYDMTDEEVRTHARKVFNNLTDDEMLYIRNDIVILANSVMHYSEIFEGFDYNNITFTSNILKYYNDSDLTSYQLIKSVGKGKEKNHIKFTDYIIGNENFYDYLKSFYAGGLNLYNDELLGDFMYNCFSMDINSSYPYAMHNFKVPTFLHDFMQFNKPTTVTLNKDEYFYLYRMTKQDFDREIIEKIKSKIVVKMLVKYYAKNDYVNINSITIDMIENITDLDLHELTIESFVSFECHYFGSRNKIDEKYKIKTKGSNKKKVDYKNPYEITELNEDNDELFTQGEIDISKVILNGLYGIPALRSHFNVFRWIGNDLENIENGYENNERNIVFSVFVTAISLYNLLDPFSYLTPYEIDNNFIYCDTDSLYFKSDIRQHLSSELFDPHILGKWDIEHDIIKQMYVVNHKKYALLVPDDKDNTKDKIIVKCGGIPNDSFNFNMKFHDFIKKQFTHGVKVKNKKSIYTQAGTIAIYDSHTDLSFGNPYRVFAYDKRIDRIRNEMIEDIKKHLHEFDDDLLYIESSLGTFSVSELNPFTHDTKNKQSLHYLKISESVLKEQSFTDL